MSFVWNLWWMREALASPELEYFYSLQHEALYAQSIHRHALAGGFLARVSPTVWARYETSEPYRSLLQLSKGAEPILPSCEEIVAGLPKEPCRT